MGKPSVNDKQQGRKGVGRWPFDPMQPGDHEPVQLPEELERLQKQTGQRTDLPAPGKDRE